MSQHEWNVQHQRYLNAVWNDTYQRWYWTHYDGQGWVFFDWIPLPGDAQKSVYQEPSYTYQRIESGNVASSDHAPTQGREGDVIQGSYSHMNAGPDSHYELLDPSFYVRDKEFFQVGKVFSILFTEPAGANARAMQYNDSISTVRYNEVVHTQIRRFVVVRQKREFCYALPIFTYGNRGTTKPGVVPDEHAIMYSYGTSPQLMPGETSLYKEPICVIMNDGVSPFHPASRVYFAIHHPIQYNVKVKDLGYVHPEHLGRLEAYWASESGMSLNTSHFAAPTTLALLNNSAFEEVRNPHMFFKTARVFMTPWTEPEGFSGQPFSETARFVVVKSGPTFSVCLRISTYSGQATTKPGVAARHHAAVIPQGTTIVYHPYEEELPNPPIEIKVENDQVDIDPMARINFAKPYTVEHNIKVRNIGRVVGDSVRRLEMYLAESLGFTKP